MPDKTPATQVRPTVERVLSAMVDVLRGVTATQVILGPVLGDVVNQVVRDLLARPQAEDDIRARAAAASNHLAEAGAILSELQRELTSRNDELSQLLASIEERREEAEHWKKLASVNEDLAQSLTREIERRVREQMRLELERNKTIRRIASFLVWLLTLFLGAIIGVWVQVLWQRGSLHIPGL